MMRESVYMTAMSICSCWLICNRICYVIVGVIICVPSSNRLGGDWIHYIIVRAPGSIIAVKTTNPLVGVGVGVVVGVFVGVSVVVGVGVFVGVSVLVGVGV